MTFNCHDNLVRYCLNIKAQRRSVTCLLSHSGWARLSTPSSFSAIKKDNVPSMIRPADLYKEVSVNMMLVIPCPKPQFRSLSHLITFDFPFCKTVCISGRRGNANTTCVLIAQILSHYKAISPSFWQDHLFSHISAEGGRWHSWCVLAAPVTSQIHLLRNSRLPWHGHPIATAGRSLPIKET